MPPTSVGTTQRDEASRILDRGFWFVLLLGVACIALVVVSMAGSLMAPGPTKHPAGAAVLPSPSLSAPAEAAAYLTPARENGRASWSVGSSIGATVAGVR